MNKSITARELVQIAANLKVEHEMDELRFETDKKIKKSIELLEFIFPEEISERLNVPLDEVELIQKQL